MGWLAMALLMHALHKNEIHTAFRQLWQRANGSRERWFWAVLALALAWWVNQPVVLPDEYLYFHQTLQWLQSEGWVHGLSNLSLPLGLGSSWHVLEAVSAPSLPWGLGSAHLNGLMYLLFLLDGWIRWGRSEAPPFFLALLWLLAATVAVPFINSTSPDLAVILLTAWSIRMLHQRSAQVALFACWVFTIKWSAILILLLPVFAWRQIDWPRSSKPLAWAVFVGSITLALVLGRNYWQTGHPFFPYALGNAEGPTWSTPPELLSFYAAGLNSYGVSDSLREQVILETARQPFAHQVLQLLGRGGWKGLFNWLVLLVTVASLVSALVRYRRNRNDWLLMLLVAGVCNVLIWLWLAPQPRFMLPWLAVAGAYLVYTVWPEGWTLQWLRRTALAGALLSALTLGYLGQHGVFHRHWNSVNVCTNRVEAGWTLQLTDSYCGDCPIPCLSATQQRMLEAHGFRLAPLGVHGQAGFRLLPFQVIP